MKISELIALLELRKEEFGDIRVAKYEFGAYVPIGSADLIDPTSRELGLEIY